MKKTLLVVALAAVGVSAFAQAEQAPEPRKPAQIVVLKKAAQANTPADGQGVQVLKVRAAGAAEQVPVDAVLRLPVAGQSSGLAQPLAKVRSQELPGLGTMPGEASDNRIKSVRVGTDRNELVYISQGQLNKIATPFESPQAIDSTGATLKAVGQDIYIQPISDKPLTVYITNGGTGQSIGLTLVPKANIPAQTIALQPDTPSGSAAVKADAEEIVAGDYVSRINGLVRSLALGKTPAGFTRSRLPTAVIAGKELVIEPQYKFAGSSYDLFSYRLRSISTTPLELKEDAFYTEAVRAVAFYPSAMLQTGEETIVFVIADRPSKEAGQ